MSIALHWLKIAFRRCRKLGLLVGILCFILAGGLALQGSAAEDGKDRGSYPSILGPCGLEFPRDHGDHPDHRTEWWYYTGNLTSTDGARYGYQLTFFRSRMRPLEDGEQRAPSAWRASQLFLAHAALTDIAGKRFVHSETIARGALGMAGTARDSSTTTVWVRNWSARIAPEIHWLTATADAFSLDLSLSPMKPPVLHGNEGYSLKGGSPERASCYYSLTRLETRGEIVLDGRTIPVSGNSWMDHEFSSAPLDEELVGWDWFSLQLSNRTELMVYLMREKGGATSAVSSGTFVPREGKPVHLTRSQIEIQVLDHWTSRKSGARYPSRWSLRIPSLGLDLVVTPNHSDQELLTPESTRVTYWEGSVDASGAMGEETVRAQGYVELTGYAQPMDARF
ncbi:MAG: lipocalin-like domain-containing protein [Syntrophobacteraceae bacterium]